MKAWIISVEKGIYEVDVTEPGPHGTVKLTSPKWCESYKYYGKDEWAPTYEQAVAVAKKIIVRERNKARKRLRQLKALAESIKPKEALGGKTP